MNSALLPDVQRIMLFLAVVMSPCLHAQAQNDPLKQLRVDYAMRFLEPAPHMALAKYFLDHGNRLHAFDTLEAARRSRFEESVFNQAFQLTFRGFDYSAAAETDLLKELSRHPQSAEVIFKLADLYIARNDLAKAKRYLAAGIKIRPDDFKYTNGLAEVLRIEGNKEEAVRLIKNYVRSYPESEAAVTFRIEELIQTEPARAKSMAIEARAKFPKSGGLAFYLARILHGEGKLSDAEQLFVEAADLSPNSPDIQAWTGRFLYKVRGNKARALDYYLNAYFLNPHTYETEFVESRIAKLSSELAEVEIERRTKAGTPLEKLLGDSNPAIVELALEQISENWKPAYLEAVLNCLEHDDGGVRWTATEAIKKTSDRTFDAKIKTLLNDGDLRKRGLAAYLAVHLWQKESFPIIKRMLADESQLIRFDAVSALILEGGAEGRRIAYEHAANEPNLTLKKMIESSRQQKDNER